jgi:membrane protein
MANIVTVFKKVSHFLNHQIWQIRLDKLDKRQGFLYKQLRIFTLAIKGFNEDNCMLKSTALTYYTLFSIVPIIALAFAIAKGFGYQEVMQQQLLQNFQDQKDVLLQAFVYADKMLSSAKGGVIAGVGVVLLLWSVMSLLGNIENTFNEIWEIKRDRTWTRKITDYLSIMLIAPVFLIISGGLTVGLQSGINSFLSDTFIVGPLSLILLKVFAFSLIWGMFIFLYMALPNTKVNFNGAAMGAFVAALLFELLEWAYVSSQVGVARFNTIYGSFAALPLFLIWVQYSWFVVMFGAELVFANQNVDHYELENEIVNISDRYKKVIALAIANHVVKNFHEGKEPLTAMEIASQLDLPVRLARNVIFDFTETGIFNEVRMPNDKETGYQPGITDSKLTVNYIIDKLEEKGINSLPIENPLELAKLNTLTDQMQKMLVDYPQGKVLVKDIFEKK